MLLGVSSKKQINHFTNQRPIELQAQHVSWYVNCITNSKQRLQYLVRLVCTIFHALFELRVVALGEIVKIFMLNCLTAAIAIAFLWVLLEFLPAKDRLHRASIVPCTASPGHAPPHCYLCAVTSVSASGPTPTFALCLRLHHCHLCRRHHVLGPHHLCSRRRRSTHDPICLEPPLLLPPSCLHQATPAACSTKSQVNGPIIYLLLCLKYNPRIR